MKALITGGAGFIGSSIAKALVKRGDGVRIVDNFATGRPSNLAAVQNQVELIEASILDATALAAAMRDIEVVFHQAAIPSVPRSIAEPVASHNVNATGTLYVLQAARQANVRRVVYAGSSSAYGDRDGDAKVETMGPLPLSPYAVSKLAGEQYCRVYSHVYGLETVVLRYFNVFGPHQDPCSDYAAVIPRFVTRALSGKGPIVFGDGTQSRDFCFIDNVVQANLSAAQALDVSGQTFNIACGASTSLNEVVAALGALMGVNLIPEHKAPRTGDIKHSLANIDAARLKLGYAAPIPFHDGLARTVDWFRGREG